MMRDFVVVGLSHRTAPVEVREQSFARLPPMAGSTKRC
jgi:glutamyl-tRNA reductase